MLSSCHVVGDAHDVGSVNVIGNL